MSQQGSSLCHAPLTTALNLHDTSLLNWHASEMAYEQRKTATSQ